MGNVTGTNKRYAGSRSSLVTVSSETDKAICYEQVFVCLGCDLLASSPRSDATTCCSKCRVWVHRHRADYESLYDWSKAMRVSVALVQQVKAIQRLRPDLSPALRDGTLEVSDTRAEVYREFIKRVFAAVEEGTNE